MTYEGYWKEKLSGRVCQCNCACRGVDPMIFNKWSHRRSLVSSRPQQAAATVPNITIGRIQQVKKSANFQGKKEKLNSCRQLQGGGEERGGGSLRSYIKSNEAAGRS